ncbi:unnamed protein product [Paramecium pentaurelia]|uniref:Uncharacterized protein n=1 Tax=Paramecium pentaurelia TaxID=43138 RepID=A0A8S1Y7U7_9CILI|nr:unnamed protein product [Paramecium pentaurelia]
MKPIKVMKPNKPMKSQEFIELWKPDESNSFFDINTYRFKAQSNKENYKRGNQMRDLRCIIIIHNQIYKIFQFSAFRI